jgi:hypothetical protein
VDELRDRVVRMLVLRKPINEIVDVSTFLRDKTKDYVVFAR